MHSNQRTGGGKGKENSGVMWRYGALEKEKGSLYAGCQAQCQEHQEAEVWSADAADRAGSPSIYLLL